MAIDHVLYFKVGHVMRMLNVSARTTVYGWIRDKKIDAIKCMDGSWSIPLSEINRILLARDPGAEPYTDTAAAAFSLDDVAVASFFGRRVK